MNPARRVWFGLLLAAVLGVAAGLFKGNEAGLRGGIGNLSAPRLLVALFPALPVGNARSAPGFTFAFMVLSRPVR
jgi:hypothetical protein